MKIASLALVTAWLLAAPVRGGDDDEVKWWHRWFGDPNAQQIADDEKLLQAAKLGVDAPALLNYLSSLIPTKRDEQTINELYKQLGSPNFPEREKASAELIELGPKALPLLTSLLPGSTLEVRMRTERCMKELEKESAAQLSAAAVRLLKTRKPANAVAALLEFAPYALDETVSEEVLDAVYRLGVRKGKINPTLEGALTEGAAARRAIAAVLVGRFGDAEQSKKVVALLADKDAEVRFRAAQGLLAKGDRAALPVLVEALKNAPSSLAERAEEMLGQAAGKTAPKTALGSDEASRKKCHAAWLEWLPVHAAKADLSMVDQDFPLPTINRRAGDVVRQFFDLVFTFSRKDGDKLARLTEIPFHDVSGKTIETRQQLEDLFAGQKIGQEGVKITSSIKRIVPLSDYLATAKQEEKELLAKFAPSEVRIVFVTITFPGEFSATGAMYVRVSGSRARVFGIGPEEMKN